MQVTISRSAVIGLVCALGILGGVMGSWANSNVTPEIMGITLIPAGPIKPGDDRTITLDADVMDADGDDLTFSWCKVAFATSGFVDTGIPAGDPRRSGPGDVVFSTPDKEDTDVTFHIAGTYVLTLTVSDGMNAPVDETVEVIVEPVEARPEDKDEFLTEQGVDGEATAMAYYAAIDPDSLKLTLKQFKEVNGFFDPATTKVFAPFFNQTDLGFGRGIEFRGEANGDIAAVTTNHLTAEDAKAGTNIIAAVTMEYSPVRPNEGKPFVKFYVYAPTNSFPCEPPGSANCDVVVDEDEFTRVLAVDLDGGGAKFVPALCTQCHGGKSRSLENGVYPKDGNIGARFLPFDVKAFEFSCQAGCTLADLEDEFKELNMYVLQTNPSKVTKELVEGWYDGSGFPSGTQVTEFVPPDWADAGESDLYLQVVAKSCRICHTALETEVLDFATFSGNPGKIRKEVFEKLNMPHALPTYDRFWLSTNPHQPDVLKEALHRFEG